MLDLLYGKRSECKNKHHFEERINMTYITTLMTYTLICKACGDFYVGKTSNSIRTRMTVHNQQKRRELRALKVNKHSIHDLVGSSISSQYIKYAVQVSSRHDVGLLNFLPVRQSLFYF